MLSCSKRRDKSLPVRADRAIHPIALLLWEMSRPECPLHPGTFMSHIFIKTSGGGSGGDAEGDGVMKRRLRT